MSIRAQVTRQKAEKGGGEDEESRRGGEYVERIAEQVIEAMMTLRLMPRNNIR